jgi:hypothetical protein
MSVAILAQAQARSIQIKCYKCISSTCDDTQNFNMIKHEILKKKKHKFEATNLRHFLKYDKAALNGSAGEPKSALDGAKRSRICTKWRQDGAKFGEDAIKLSQCGAKSGRGGTRLSKDGTRLHKVRPSCRQVKPSAARIAPSYAKIAPSSANMPRS